jgi:hypothetical protein
MLEVVVEEEEGGVLAAVAGNDDVAMPMVVENENAGEEVVPLVPDAVRAQLAQLAGDLDRHRAATLKARAQWELCAGRHLHFLGELAVRSLTYLEDTFAAQMKDALKKVRIYEIIKKLCS